MRNHGPPTSRRWAARGGVFRLEATQKRELLDRFGSCLLVWEEAKGQARWANGPSPPGQIGREIHMQRGTLSPHRSAHLQTRRRLKVGFTLVELLVVLMIIGMLASMVSFAMFRSQQAAREAKTQALIAKLHNVIARQWDTYVSRQVAGDTPEERLLAIQSLIQLEMPDTSAELTDADGLTSVMNQTITNGTETSLGYVDAQCLYHLVSQIADDDLDRINFFSETEARDLNNDGSLDVFIDGWGNPIGFIRQPTGFPSTLSDLNDPNSPDPFDLTDSPSNGVYFPLIFSYGPDKSSGLTASTGTPNSGNDHIDNIHNHRMNARLQ